MFEEAKAQLEAQITQEANPQQAEATGDLAPDVPSEEAKQLEAVADLSKYKKVKIGDEEISLEDLRKQRMLEADYRRKTHELAEQRRQHELSAKFDVNFKADLDVILRQPWMAKEFYKIYPQEYHAQVKQIERMYQANPNLWASDQGEEIQQSQNQSVDIERLLEEKLNQRLKPFEEKERMEQQKLHLATLDAIETKLTAKYENANKFEVYAAAEHLSKETEEFPNGRELTESDWEKIYKDSHDRNSALIDKAVAKKFNQQKATNNKLKDVQGGGGVPGEAPFKAKSIREATEAMLKGM